MVLHLYQVKKKKDMIKFLIIPGLIILSCGSTKTKQSASVEDSVVVSTSTKDSLNKNLAGKMQNGTLIPDCIQSKIDSFKLKETHEMPQRVVAYEYKGKTVFYVEMPCCDFFNEVYDDKCNYLGAPDGGFTGKGDGKLPDFLVERKSEQLIWKAGK